MKYSDICKMIYDEVIHEYRMELNIEPVRHAMEQRAKHLLLKHGIDYIDVQVGATLINTHAIMTFHYLLKVGDIVKCNQGNERVNGMIGYIIEINNIGSAKCKVQFEDFATWIYTEWLEKI